jgi:hypothetical protein
MSALPIFTSGRYSTSRFTRSRGSGSGFVATSGIGTGAGVGLTAGGGGGDGAAAGAEAITRGAGGAGAGVDGVGGGVRVTATGRSGRGGVTTPAFGAATGGFDTGGSAGTVLCGIGVADGMAGGVGGTPDDGPVGSGSAGVDPIQSAGRLASSWKPGIRLGIALAAIGGAELERVGRRRMGGIATATSLDRSLRSGS